MSFESTQLKGNEIIKITSTEDITTENLKKFEEAVDKAAGLNPSSYVFDFTNTGYICSMGLGVIVTLLKKMEKNSKKIYIYGLNDTNKVIFDATKLSELVVISNNLNDIYKQLGINN